MATALRNDLDFDFYPTAFRMFNVYGERQRIDNPYQGALGFFIGNALRNDIITIHSDGEQTRDFIYITDVLDAWTLALTNPHSYGKVFNLGVGKAISINKLVDEVLLANNYSRSNYPIRYAPCRPGDQRAMVADITSAQSILGWNPSVTLLEGLSKTMLWAKGNFKDGR